MAAEQILINGKSTDCLSALDRGLQYGDGVFETIAVRAGKLCLWERHMQRLQEGCDRLAISSPESSLLESEALSVSRNTPDGVCKITITRGVGGRGYRPQAGMESTRVVACFESQSTPSSHYELGINARFSDTSLARNPSLAGIKHLNRLEQVLARNEWQDPEIFEGIMCDEDGQVIEGTMSNLFAWNGGELFTPDLGRCGVNGIARTVVLEQAHGMDIACHVTSMSREFLLAAESLFITNSLIGLLPIRNIGTHSFDVTKIPDTLKQAAMQEIFSP